jgi:hypothetical protein
MTRAHEDVLAATNTVRSELRRRGCVSFGRPPSFNPRLSSQHGCFLFNGTEELSFAESLDKMMSGKTNWHRVIHIPGNLEPEIQRQLFRLSAGICKGVDLTGFSEI